MQGLEHSSAIGDLVAGAVARCRYATTPKPPLPSAHERYFILQGVLNDWQHLKPTCTGRNLETAWIEQVCDYLTRLQNSPAATTPQEQFNHLYMLRKWVLWAPATILNQPSVDMVTMLVVGYLYTTSIALAPLFPEIEPLFSAAASVRPVEAIIGRHMLMQGQDGYAGNVDVAQLLQWPRAVVSNFRARYPWAYQAPQIAVAQYSTDYANDESAYVGFGAAPSPAFVPSQPQSVNHQASSSRSSLLSVPSHDPRYDSASSWGAFPSPGMPPMDFGSHDMTFQPLQMQYDFDDEASEASYEGFHGGFVDAPAIWT